MRKRQRSVVNLHSKEVLTGLFLSRQTYSLIFLWALTWFSYWIFLKSQLNTFNIAGAVISAALIVCSYVLPSRGVFSKTLKLRGVFQKAETSGFEPAMSSLRKNKKKIAPVVVAPLDQPRCTPQLEEFTPQETLPEEPEQRTWEPEIIVAPQAVAKSNGCPKNLEYFTTKPRPKSPPAECMDCEKLLDCVCQTSS